MTRILCTVCARGGSKGIPNKNLREVGGKPLVAHSIEHALQWNRETDLIVSTDSEKIRDVAVAHGVSVPFLRPDELATDKAAKLPAIQHATRQMEAKRERTYDYVVDLDATAPLRTVNDIEKCFRTVKTSDATNAYTVTNADKNPYFNMVELDKNGYAHLSKQPEEGIDRRQEAPTVYEMNASVYVYERDFLLQTDTIHGDRTKVSIMPPNRSIDIDTPLDLEFVRFLKERNNA